MDKRPLLNENIRLEDFKSFYWLKTELTAFCKEVGIPRQGSKLALATRIEQYIETGIVPVALKERKSSSRSKFDWHTAPLLPTTLLTDNYKNTENVRSFFKTHIGEKFKFNVVFMNWLKTNTGKDLAAAIVEWHRIKQVEKERTSPKIIAPQFEYNTYLRDFLQDNPTSSRATAIAHWKLKKSQRGDNVYRKSDLEMKT